MPKISRRSMLTSSAGALAGAMALSATSAHALGDAVASGQRVLVVLTLRGGFDGLGALVPTQIGPLKDARPMTGPDESSLIALNDDFAADAALAPLADLFRSGQLSFVHAVGAEKISTNHEQAWASLLSGLTSTRNSPQGWLARALPQQRAWGAVALGQRSGPAVLQGANGLVQLASLDQLQIPAPPGISSEAWLSAMARMWRGDEGTEHAVEALRSLQTAVPVLRQVNTTPNSNLLEKSALARELNDAATLIRTDLGVQAISIEHHGWDTHVNFAPTQGAARPGTQQLTELAAALRHFWDSLGTDQNRVTVMTVTEFGRTVAENPTQGTEHGQGSAMLLLGAGVHGGQVAGDWPGLKPAAGAALRATLDWRQVAAEVLQRAWHVDPQQVFTGLRYQPVGLMSA